MIRTVEAELGKVQRGQTGIQALEEKIKIWKSEQTRALKRQEMSIDNLLLYKVPNDMRFHGIDYSSGANKELHR